MGSVLDGLNEAQREAVTTTEGYVRVVAGAGSGKTRALTHRFAYLVNEIGILPGHILCVTFTNKAAGEMRQRIHNLTGDDDTGYICTFHSFCVSVLQEDSHVVQYPKNFMVLDNSDIDTMLGIIYEERGLTLRHMTFSKARDMIEKQKLLQKPEYYLDLIALPLDMLFQKYREASSTEDIIFYGYLYQEKKCFGLDYNDLIKFSLYIFAQDETVKRKWQQRLEYIMIDEFQDIDALQYELMEVLCGYHKNLFIVGDPDQTIYTWRGADIRYLTEFDRNFPGTHTIRMMENYRSTPQILAAANSLIAKNENRIPKDLTAVCPDGAPVRCHHAEDPAQEAEWIADQILQMRGEGRACRDIALLCRAHYITRNIEEVLIREKIPYTVCSGVQFFERKEIRDALAYLRMIAYRDDLSFLRIANVPKRSLGKRRMQFLQEYAQTNACSLFEALERNLEEDLFRGTKGAEFVDLIRQSAQDCADKPVSKLLAEVLDASGYEAMLRTEGSQERLDNLAEFKQSVYDYETTCGEECSLEDYLAHVALFTDSDVEEKRDRVKLMTVQAAKGLEFPFVCLCGMNEGSFPSGKTKTREAMEEERRLAFVAVTRAEQILCFSEAGGRNFDRSPRYPSRFLLDIGDGLMEHDPAPQEGLIEEARNYIRRSERRLAEEKVPLLEEGVRVCHPILGEGTILETDAGQGLYRIQFDRIGTPRDISVRMKLTVMEEEEEQPIWTEKDGEQDIGCRER